VVLPQNEGVARQYVSCGKNIFNGFNQYEEALEIGLQKAMRILFNND
jgi:hypothetical protein